MKAMLVGVTAALVLARRRQPRRAGASPAVRPRAPGWQALANKVYAPVYCPTWMPNPLDAQMRGQYHDIYSIGKDRSYLVSFLEHGDDGSGDVHVNFRGYPGRTTIPTCATTIPNGKKTIRASPPPFSTAGQSARTDITATVYRVNQDADQWHILLAWKQQGRSTR